MIGVFLLFIVGACEKEEIEALQETDAPGFGQLKSGEAGIIPIVYTTYDLIAGQNIKVGEVLVWNDETNLHVTYVITEIGWCLTETHLQVSTNLFEPVPGLFDYSGEHECETVVPYTIPLNDIGGSGGGGYLNIATHAVVEMEEGCWETVWQIGDEEVDATTGWLENYADEFNWGVGYIGDKPLPTPISLGPSLTDHKPAFTSPFIVGTTPWTEFPYNSNSSFSNNYATDFDVQWTGPLPAGGKLTMSWSPGASATEKKVVIDGTSSQEFVAIGTPTKGAGWFLDKYPLVVQSMEIGKLKKGVHTINFKHTEGDGTFWDWIRLEKPCGEETAWGAGTRFSVEANWATYFTYTIDCCYEWVIYGSNLGGSDEIWEINLKDQTKSLVHNPGILDVSVNYPNGNAYDPFNKRIYLAATGKLYFYDVDDIDFVGPMTIIGSVACGAWYNGAYYYVKNGSDDLYKVIYNGGNTVTCVKLCDFTDNDKRFGFGDIVFDPETPGLLLGSASVSTGGYEYFTIDLEDNCKYYGVKTIAKHKQLAFGSDGTLYGLDAQNGTFYTIDKLTGDETVFWTAGSEFTFTDLASGPQCDY